jgi:hypothetical protein
MIHKPALTPLVTVMSVEMNHTDHLQYEKTMKCVSYKDFGVPALYHFSDYTSFLGCGIWGKEPKIYF